MKIEMVILTKYIIIKMKKIAQTNYSGATAIEIINWDYKDISAEEFLKEAFERAKRLAALRVYNP